jgi:hypothetical protein
MAALGRPIAPPLDPIRDSRLVALESYSMGGFLYQVVTEFISEQAEQRQFLDHFCPLVQKVVQFAVREKDEDVLKVLKWESSVMENWVNLGDHWKRTGYRPEVPRLYGIGVVEVRRMLARTIVQLHLAEIQMMAHPKFSRDDNEVLPTPIPSEEVNYDFLFRGNMGMTGTLSEFEKASRETSYIPHSFQVAMATDFMRGEVVLALTEMANKLVATWAKAKSSIPPWMKDLKMWGKKGNAEHDVLTAERFVDMMGRLRDKEAAANALFRSIKEQQQIATIAVTSETEERGLAPVGVEARSVPEGEGRPAGAEPSSSSSEAEIIRPAVGEVKRPAVDPELMAIAQNQIFDISLRYLEYLREAAKALEICIERYGQWEVRYGELKKKEDDDPSDLQKKYESERKRLIAVLPKFEEMAFDPSSRTDKRPDIYFLRQVKSLAYMNSPWLRKAINKLCAFMEENTFETSAIMVDILRRCTDSDLMEHFTMENICESQESSGLVP